MRKVILFLISSASLFLSLFLSLETAWKVLLMVFIFLTVFLFFRQKGNTEKNILLSILFFFSAGGIFCEYMISFDVIAYSWRYFNILEHVIILFSLGILFFFFFRNVFQKMSLCFSSFFLFASLMTFGYFLEIIQFLWRTFLLHSSPDRMALYYEDTMIDMMSNIVGASLSIFCIFLLFRFGVLKK